MVIIVELYWFVIDVMLVMWLKCLCEIRMCVVFNFLGLWGVVGEFVKKGFRSMVVLFVLIF